MRRWGRRERTLVGVVIAAACGALSACATLAGLGLGRDGDGRVVQTDTGHCVDLVPENAAYPVRACEAEDRYELTVAARRLALGKRAFQAALRERILQYLRPTPYPWLTLKRATVEVWVTAPVFAPQDASLVAVVLGAGDGGNFAVRLPLHPAEWHVSDASVAFLGGHRYPTLAAKQVGRIALQPRAHVTRLRLERFLAATGALARTDLVPAGVDGGGIGAAWQPATLATKPFAESAVAQLIMRHREARDVVGEIAFLPAGEREGAKALAFTFPFWGR